MDENMAMAVPQQGIAKRSFQVANTEYSFEDMYRVCELVAASGLFGQGVANLDKKSPGYVTEVAKVFTRAIAGAELGLGIPTANRELYIVNGRVGMSAALMVALAKRGGYRIVVKQSTDTFCTTECWDRQGMLVGSVTFKIEEAQRAGLVKQGGAWTTWPADMCYNRSVSRLVRRCCTEVFMGGVYTTDELREGVRGTLSADDEVLQATLAAANPPDSANTVPNTPRSLSEATEQENGPEFNLVGEVPAEGTPQAQPQTPRPRRFA